MMTGDGQARKPFLHQKQLPPAPVNAQSTAERAAWYVSAFRGVNVSIQ